LATARGELAADDLLLGVPARFVVREHQVPKRHQLAGRFNDGDFALLATPASTAPASAGSRT
jgi:hypothetical protein